MILRKVIFFPYIHITLTIFYEAFFRKVWAGFHVMFFDHLLGQISRQERGRWWYLLADNFASPSSNSLPRHSFSAFFLL